jgi:DNA-binding Lrp family transcriptional regulator
LDSVDQKIIHILQADARKSYVEIANEIGFSESAIRRRVKNLLDTGVIKRFTIETDSGDKTNAITLISVSSTSDTPTVSTDLMKIKGVQVIYEITGIISAPTIEEINKCIDEVRKANGVSDTNTVIVLKMTR